MGVGGVRRIEVTERKRPVFGGTEFGAVGPYERLHGTIFGELDPTHPLNVGLVNLDRAARNAHGNVEYQSDFRILRPLDLDRGNGCLDTTCPIAATSRSCRGSTVPRTVDTPSMPATGF
jgi:hypothetical protein